LLAPDSDTAPGANAKAVYVAYNRRIAGTMRGAFLALASAQAELRGD